MMNPLLLLLSPDTFQAENPSFFFLTFLLGLFLLVQYLAQDEQIRPQEQFGDLFKAVQLQGVFPDSKTFPDCIPVLSPELVMEAYHAEKDLPGFDLHAFVFQYFKMPAQPATNPGRHPARLSRARVMTATPTRMIAIPARSYGPTVSPTSRTPSNTATGGLT